MNGRNSWIPLGRPEVGAEEVAAMSDALGQLGQSSDRSYVRLCEASLRAMHAPADVLLTHSCTAAIELAALIWTCKRAMR